MFKKKPIQNSNQRTVGNRQQTNVFSYYNNRNRPETPTGRYDKPPAVRSQTPRRSLKPVLVLLVLLGFLGWDVIIAGPVGVVSTMPADKALLKDNRIYEQTAFDVLNSSVFYKTKLTFNPAHFASEFERRHPEAGPVSVHVPLFGHHPSVELHPTQPAFILTAANGSYIIDERGTAVLSLAEARSQLRAALPTVLDETGSTIESGKAVLPRDSTTYITYLIAQLKAKNYAIESITLPAVANELDLRIQGHNYLIRMNLSSDPASQVGALLATLKKFEDDKITPGEYLDVRVDERVYFK